MLVGTLHTLFEAILLSHINLRHRCAKLQTKNKIAITFYVINIKADVFEEMLQDKIYNRFVKMCESLIRESQG